MQVRFNILLLLYVYSPLFMKYANSFKKEENFKKLSLMLSIYWIYIKLIVNLATNKFCGN